MDGRGGRGQIIELPRLPRFGAVKTGKGVPMNLSSLGITEGGNSLVATLRSYFARYQMLLYILFAAATSLSVVWNWNWLTGAEVFRIMASLPSSFMMLMCMKRAACR